MAGIKAKDTKPEMIVRRGLHAAGFRFRLHDRKLPGKPDLVLPKYRAVIFVNGCFWHGHECAMFKWPKTREEFWRTKIERNRAVDIQNAERLTSSGWRLLTVWECALRKSTNVAIETTLQRVVFWLTAGQSSQEIAGRFA